MANFDPWLVTLIGSLVLYVSGVQIQDGSCTYRKWEEIGHVKFLLIGGVYENEAGQCKSRLSRDGITKILAFDWLIRVLNGNSSNGQPFIPGLKIGYDLYENCDNEDLTTDLLYSDQQMSNCTGQQNTQNIYAAAISLTNPKSTLIMSRFTQPLPVLRPLPSTPVLQGIPNLVQTVASFQFEIQAMVDFMSQAKWNYIALISEGTEDGKEMAKQFTTNAKNSNLCVKFHYSLQTDSDVIKVSAGNIIKDLFNHISSAYNLSIVIVYMGSVRGANHTVEESKEQPRRSGSRLTWVFPSIVGNHSDLKDLLQMKKEDGDHLISFNYPTESINEINNHYESIVNGNVESPIADIVNTNRDTFSAVPVNIDHTNNIINAVLVVTAALKAIWEDSCTVNGLNIDSCTSFYADLETEMVDQVQKSLNITDVFGPDYLPESYQRQEVMIEFDDNGALRNSSLEVNLYTPATDTEITLFTYRGDSVPGISVVLPTSVCSDEAICSECREAIDLRFSYLPGDYLILGLFSLRVYEDNSYKCASLRRGTNDIITVSAFMQAILDKRVETGMNFGGIAIDDCYSPYNTSHYLSGLFSKTVILRDPNTDTIIDFDKVFSVIGALSSSVSLVIGDVTTSIRLPMVSYAASSPELDNRNRYPYFLRTVPSDILQVRGIISLIKHLNVTRVGLIYIDDSYGRGGLENLMNEAAQNHICIHQPLRVFQGMSDDELDTVRRTLYEQQIGVVIYFSIDSIAQRLLQKMDENDASRPIVFIASEAWGTNLDLITNRLGRQSKGSLVFNIDTLQYTNTVFKTFLQNLNVSQTSYNRWIPNYFEKFNDCDFIDSFEKYYSEICDKQSEVTLDQSTINSLDQDQRGIHIMNAVHTVTEGYKQLCQDREPLACSRLQPDKFTQVIDDVTINGRRVFTSEGNGDIGMTIFNIQRVTTSPAYTFKYERVGSFSKDGILSITQPLTFYGEFKQEVTNIRNVYESMTTDIDCNMFEDTCSDVCLRPASPNPATTTSLPVTPAPAKDDGLMRGLTIAFGALAGIMAVALILLIVLLFRRQDSERPSSDGKYSTEATSVDAGNVSVYDEPGTIHYGRSQSENNVNVTGSFLSLQDTSPTQYAHIQPSPVPIHHRRHRSNQELISHHGYLQDRPASPMSAPITQPQISPAARQVAAIHKRSPRISHSPHSVPRSTELYKKRIESSPRFRYPSKYNTEPNTSLKVSSVDSPPVLRRDTILSDDYERNSVFVDDSGIEPSTHQSDSYLYPQTSYSSNSSDKPKLTYLTAQDLVDEDSEDEEDKNAIVEPEPFRKDSVQKENIGNTPQPNQMLQYGYDPSLISPSDNEITAINFPESDKVRFSKSQKPITLKEDQNEANLIDSVAADRIKAPNVLHTDSSGNFSPSGRSNQPDIIPEFGPFDSDDGIIII